MAKRSVGTLFVDIEARTAQIEKDMARTRQIIEGVAKSTTSMSSRFSQGFGMAKVAVAAFAVYMAGAGINAIRTQTLGVYENIRAMAQLANRYNVTVFDVQAYTKASENLGVTQFNLAKALKSSNSLLSEARKGSGSANAELRRLGTTINELSGKMPADQFETLVSRINAMPTASERAAAATRVFGKEAENMGDLIHRGGEAIAEARKQVVAYGADLSRMDVAKVRVALQAIAEMKDTWEATRQRMAISLTPVFTAVAKGVTQLLNTLDVDAIADKIEFAVARIWAFFTTLGTQFELIGLRIKKVVAEIKVAFNDTPVGRLTGQLETAKAKVTSLDEQILALTDTLYVDFDAAIAAFGEAVDKQMADIGDVTVETENRISEAALAMRDSFATAFSSMADMLGDWAATGEFTLRNFTDNIVRSVISMAAKLAIINPFLNTLFSGATGYTPLATMWSGPAKAMGGPYENVPFLAGENGPEIVDPRQKRVIPNDRLGSFGGSSGGGTIIHINASNSQLGVIQEIKAGLSHLNATFEDRAVGANIRARVRGGGPGRSLGA